jgi:GH25 family lysozyme M1 (1,4-beta-N-acetylmuramidase)
MSVLRRAAVSVTALATVATGGVLLPPAGGATAAAPPVPIADRHPNRDWMGSQVAKHLPKTAGAAASSSTVPQVPGLDVSGWQGNVDWSRVAANGAKFAIVKATEGTYYRNPYFSQQYTGAYNHGIIHGAYHFATPDTSGGAAQADYFVAHGGGWSSDGRTFPGMLDIEWNPYGGMCYGKSQTAMTAWILAFSNEYHRKTTRWPLIYTANAWWATCVGRTGDFSSTNPLVLACYCSSPGTFPYNWPWQTIWQWADHGVFPGDQDRFNGDMTRVRALAQG